MKHERRNSCLIAALLAAVISFSGVSCMATGTGMSSVISSFMSRVSLTQILVFCAGFSLLAAVLGYYVPHGVLLCACSSILLVLGLFWPKGYLTGWASALVYYLSSLYHQGYGWPIIQFGTADPRAISLMPSLCAVAGGVILAVVGCLRSRKAVWPAVAASLLPLAVCLVLTDTVPSVWCMILLIGSLVVLLLASAVRRRSGAEGNRLIMGLLLPVFLATAVLFAAIPMQSYIPPSPQLGAEFLDWASGLPLFNVTGPGALGGETDEISLSSVGPKNRDMIDVMRVVSSENGSLYLRGQTYIKYDGLHWEKQNCTESGWPRSLVPSGGAVSISTRRTLDLLYTPYYVDGQSSRSGGLENENQLRQYEFVLRIPGPGDAPALISDLLEEQCLTLPPSTLKRAIALLDAQGIPHSGQISDVDRLYETVPALHTAQVPEIIEKIASYVRNSARYDLQTQKLPAGEDDFALWFLEESDTGYCTHFASAAVVLLRAAGIPSRYVTGYMAETKANTSTVIRAYQAHAWVEYFTPEAGWQVLEVTPSENEPVPPTTTQPPETTQGTQPPETTQGTQPPESSGETEPPDTTTEPGFTPEDPGPQNPGQPTAPAKVSPLVWALLGVGLVIVAILGQYALRLLHRCRKLKRGNSRQQALYRWRIARLWSRHVAGNYLPQALKQLAEKAMFSQHEIEPQELAQFDEYFAQCAELLRQMPRPKRLMKMLLWALPR